MTSKLEIKNHWQYFIVQQQPTTLITLTLRKWNRGVTNDETAIKQFNQVLWFTNRSLFRKRYDKGIEYLAGFAAFEHQANGMPHVHIMITNRLDIDKLRSIIGRHVSRIVHKGRGRNYKLQAEYREKYKSGVPLESMRDEVIAKCTCITRLIQTNGIDVRVIHRTEQDFTKVSKYLQKETPEFLLLDKHGLVLRI